jgi:Protein of unknown function (DUF3301)
MELDWSLLAMIGLAAGAAWFWQSSLAARDSANKAAAEACERLSLQLLDSTVAFARIAVVRNRAGRLALQRTYVFDYSADSIARRQGFVVLISQKVESVGYAPGESNRAIPVNEPPPPPPPSKQRPTTLPSNVLNLEDWRTRHRKPQERHAPPREDRGDGRK